MPRNQATVLGPVPPAEDQHDNALSWTASSDALHAGLRSRLDRPDARSGNGAIGSYT